MHVISSMRTEITKICSTWSLCGQTGAETIRTKRLKITILGSYLLANRLIQSCRISSHLVSHFDFAFRKCDQLWHSAASLRICDILWLGLKIIKLFAFISMESPKQDLESSNQDYFVGANSSALIYKSGLVWVCFETKMVQWQKVG